MKKSCLIVLGCVLLFTSCENTTAQNGSKQSKKAYDKSKSEIKNKGSNLTLAPDFELADLEGNKFKLSSLRGKVVLLNFWGTWCGPCKREIPDFINLMNDHRDEGFEIIGVTLTSGSAEKIKDFSKKWGINYTLLTDLSNSETQIVTQMYGQATKQPITGIPTTFIIDRDGYIRQRYVGPRSEEVFYKDLQPYL